MARVILAGVIGGIAMFAWTSIAHMVLPLGQTGVGEIPNDRELLQALHAKLGDTSGFYMFPGFGLAPDASMREKNAAMDVRARKLATSPSGLLVYHPPGAKELTPVQLLIEFLTELSEALLAAWLLAKTRLEGYVRRVGFILCCGVLAALATNISYWNWYGFPASYTAAYITVEIVGFLCAGLVIAKMSGTPAVARAAAG